MFQSSHFSQELQSLKNDMSRLFGAASDEILDASKEHADAIASQIKTVLNGIGETLDQEEDRIGEIISERPIATLASVFVMGLVVGLILRRH